MSQPDIDEIVDTYVSKYCEKHPIYKMSACKAEHMEGDVFSQQNYEECMQKHLTKVKRDYSHFNNITRIKIAAAVWRCLKDGC